MSDYFTADTHYHHSNIVRGTTKWTDGNRGIGGQRVRDFNTLEDHDAVLVHGTNSRVGENDTLYHLGDWSFGGIDQIWAFRKQLMCRNIHLILGNHDHHIRDNKVLRIPVEDYALYCYITGKKAVATANNWYEVGAQSLFTTVSERKYISIGKQEIVLDHFAGRVWLRSHHGSWNLHGHSHGTLFQMDVTGNDPIYMPETLLAKQMDVGVDTNYLYPYSFEEIKKIMDFRNNLKTDHHNEHTN